MRDNIEKLLLNNVFSAIERQALCSSRLISKAFLTFAPNVDSLARVKICVFVQTHYLLSNFYFLPRVQYKIDVESNAFDFQKFNIKGTCRDLYKEAVWHGAMDSESTILMKSLLDRTGDNIHDYFNRIIYLDILITTSREVVEFMDGCRPGFFGAERPKTGYNCARAFIDYLTCCHGYLEEKDPRFYRYLLNKLSGIFRCAYVPVSRLIWGLRLHIDGPLGQSELYAEDILRSISVLEQVAWYEYSMVEESVPKG
jgi:hypothetical protein